MRWKDLIKELVSLKESNNDFEFKDNQKKKTSKDKLTKDVKIPTLSDYENINVIKIPKPKCYSKFKYLKTTDFYGLSEIQKENKIQFLIPCGLEWDDSLKFWFIVFPFNGTNENITEFFTAVNPTEV